MAQACAEPCRTEGCLAATEGVAARRGLGALAVSQPALLRPCCKEWLLGTLWALSGRSLGAIWALSGRYLRAIWALSGRYLGAIWTLSGRYLSAAVKELSCVRPR